MQGQYVVEATNDYGTSSDYFELVVNDGMSLSLLIPFLLSSILVYLKCFLKVSPVCLLILIVSNVFPDLFLI